MKKIIIITLSLLGVISMQAQNTFGLKLSEVSNDGTNYIVKIEMQMHGDNNETFKLGSSALQFEFPGNALINPILESSNLASPMPYYEPTVTTPLSNLCSFNIELVAPNYSQDFTIAEAPGWTEIGEIKFEITNPNELTSLSWLYNGSTTQTVVYLADEATQIFLTNEDENNLVVEELEVVSVLEIGNNNPVTISPNPMTTESVVTLDNDMKSANQVSMKLINNLGQVVRTRNVEMGNSIITIKRNNLPSGIYFLQLQSNNDRLSLTKLVIE